jgi:CDP-glycerol glycerophosphotransferase
MTPDPAHRPTLTLVVAIYNVEPYLRQCFDSILSQRFTDVEVIAVNDASTDNSPRIVEEYARADSRVVPVMLEENGGLGNARNIGLDRARGEYIMFIDSDDWLEGNSLEAIARRLQKTTPDVMFFDYARAYWNGRIQRNVRHEIFREPGPEVFTLRERPDVMLLLMVAWNKAYRIEFLRELGQRFMPGYYEDLPVTYPVLMAADRISLLDRVCYYYRQRRTGAITKTPGRRHFEVFDKYDNIFAFMEARPELDEFRPAMFERMIWHYLIILSQTGRRVRHEDREEFFHEVAAHYAAYEPPGFVPPAALDQRVKYDMLKRNAYTAFQVFKGANAAWLSVQSRGRKVMARVRKLVRQSIINFRLARYRLFLRQPIDENLAVFAAYWYRGYTCNPRAIYEKLRELAPHIRGVWVVAGDMVERMPPGIPYVVEGSIEYYRVLARAKYFVNNVNFPNFLIKRRGQIHLETQHGTPLKTMGVKLREFPVAAKGMNFSKLLERADRWDFHLSMNRFSTEIWKRDFPCDYEMLEYGYPRNDWLHAPDPEHIARLRKELGVPDGRTAVLYAPTFREYSTSFSLQMDLERLCGEISDEYVLLLRAHYFYDDEAQNDTIRRLEKTGKLIDVSQHSETAEVLLASDMLITDYSSVMFDYANLGRPIVIYANDWDIYKVVRGVNFDLMAEPPGAIATTEDELIEIFRSRSYESADAHHLLYHFRARFCMFDDGNAAERAVRRVFLGEQIAPPDPVLPEEPAHVSSIPATGEADPVGP